MSNLEKLKPSLRSATMRSKRRSNVTKRKNLGICHLLDGPWCQLRKAQCFGKHSWQSPRDQKKGLPASAW